MSEKTNFHFELSERKLLLRFLDVSLILLGLHFVGSVFEFDYFTIREDKWIWSLLLGFYILFFGSVFEIYHLRKSSNFFKILKGIVATSSITILVYILTPFFSPELPESRIQIIYFYISIIISMSIGRLAYILLINSPIFKKSILLVADGEMFEGIERDLAIADANYKIKYFVNTNNDSNVSLSDKEVSSIKLKEYAQKGIHEIVVTRSSKFSSSELYSDLLDLFNQGHVIKEYSEVYEELSGRVYISFKDKDFYKQFPFSQHKVKPLYRLMHRFFDIIIRKNNLNLLIWNNQLKNGSVASVKDKYKSLV